MIFRELAISGKSGNKKDNYKTVNELLPKKTFIGQEKAIN